MSEAEKPHLIFAKHFGSLRPVNEPARDALAAMKDGTQIRVRITRMTANQRRRGFMWVMLSLAAKVMTDQTGDPWDAELLHYEAKRALKLGKHLYTPSGREIFKPASTADRAMDESERARWVDRLGMALSHWLGMPVEDFMQEARDIERLEQGDHHG